MANKSMFEPFNQLKKHNKLLFTFIVGTAIILFWKGTWNIWDFVFDVFIFHEQHYFWSNFTAMIVGFLILFFAGLVLEKLA